MLTNECKMDEVWNICYKGHVTCLTYHSIQATAELPCICHILPVSVKAGGIFRFINPFFYQGTGNLHENRFLDRFWWLWTQWRSWTTISEMNRKNHLAFLILFDSPSAIYFYWMLNILLIVTNWLRHFEVSWLTLSDKPQYKPWVWNSSHRMNYTSSTTRRYRGSIKWYN